MDISSIPDIHAARAGDQAAFGRLHARWHRVVHAVLLSRLGAQDAEDLVQDVFVTAWLRLPELADPAAFPGWLCAIARNRATDLARRRRPLALAADIAAPRSDGVDVHEILATIHALPEAYRETLVLRLVDGYAGPEIAALTGLTEGSVRVNLHRGMALLRERLAEKGFP